MNLQEIKSAIAAGNTVCWKNPMYVVRKNGNLYDVECTANGDSVGLTWIDGVTMEGKEEDFFVMNDNKDWFARQVQTAPITVMRQSDILKCSHCIMMPEHYKQDGSCRCGDVTHTVMAEWGYEWDGKGWIASSSD